MSENINRVFYINLFDKLWDEKKFEDGIKIYEFLGRIFERATYVAEYYASKGLLDKSMIEYEFFIESCLQISHDFLPYPSGPESLYLLGEYFEKTEPLKSEKYLKLYLQAEQFELTTGEGIKYKNESQEILKRIHNANQSKLTTKELND